MKTILQVLTLALLLIAASYARPITTSQEEYYYICDSETAYAYHKFEDCRGLAKCTHEIKKVTLYHAKNTYKKKKYCGYCDHRD